MPELNSSSQYYKEVAAIAAALVAECMQECDNDREAAEELINDIRLNETIDGHQWVIYYSYNLPVLQYSSNSEYMVDSMGVDCVGEILKESGLSGLHSALADWALYADVQEQLSTAFDDYETQEEA